MSATVFSEPPWLFGKRADLLAFGGSALLSFVLLGVGAALGVLESDVPDWTWLACVLVVDVAHVWSTIYRVYLDPSERMRRPWTYFGMPVAVYALGVALHAHDAMTFWRVLAYVAVFHFVRQQAGWLSLYHRRAPDTSVFDMRLDRVAIYVASVYPLVWWHGHLPRRFTWFMEGDFIVGLSSTIATALMPVYVAVGVAWLARTLYLTTRGRFHAGKALLMTTTWACWGVGILAFDGDFAFTVTNVLIHGVPYIVLTTRYGRVRAAEGEAFGPAMPRWVGRSALLLLGVIIAIAFCEELLWDQLVWHDRPHVFGEGVDLDAGALMWLSPLLALPQAVHYALDGVVWRGAQNPRLGVRLGLSAPTPAE